MEKNEVRANALQVIKGNLDFANSQIETANYGRKEKETAQLFTLRSFIEDQVKTNMNFLRWLFNDYDNIGYYGKGMNEAQKEAFEKWFSTIQ